MYTVHILLQQPGAYVLWHGSELVKGCMHVSCHDERRKPVDKRDAKHVQSPACTSLEELTGLESSRFFLFR